MVVYGKSPAPTIRPRSALRQSLKDILGVLPLGLNLKPALRALPLGTCRKPVLGILYLPPTLRLSLCALTLRQSTALEGLILEFNLVLVGRNQGPRPNLIPGSLGRQRSLVVGNPVLWPRLVVGNLVMWPRFIAGHLIIWPRLIGGNLRTQPGLVIRNLEMWPGPVVGKLELKVGLVTWGLLRFYHICSFRVRIQSWKQKISDRRHKWNSSFVIFYLSCSLSQHAVLHFTFAWSSSTQSSHGSTALEKNTGLSNPVSLQMDIAIIWGHKIVP